MRDARAAPAARPGTHPPGARRSPDWRRTLGATAGLTALAATVGAVQLVTGTFTPPISDLEPLGLTSWTIPGLWLAASVAVPCGGTAVLAWRGSARSGAAAVVAGGLLGVELAVQVPFVGLDPLQAVMGLVAAGLVALGGASHVRSSREGDEA
jgi:hypothetical protein